MLGSGNFMVPYLQVSNVRIKGYNIFPVQDEQTFFGYVYEITDDSIHFGPGGEKFFLPLADSRPWFFSLAEATRYIVLEYFALKL